MKQMSDLLMTVVPKELREEVSNRMVVNDDLLKYITLFLEKRIQENSKERMSKASFKSSAWPYMQAHCNGYEAALNETITILKPRELSDND